MTRTIDPVDAILAATLGGGLVGLAVGGIAAFAFRISERTQKQLPEHPEPVVPPDVAKVLGVLRSTAIVVGPHDEVLQASAPARAYGLVRGARVVIDELLDMVRQVRRDGEIRQCDLEIPRDHIGRDRLSVAARVAPISSRLILVLVEDRTKERRLDAIRRDFVANVNHELRTPIGALTVLSEALAGERDAATVDRLAVRIHAEAQRAADLIDDLLEFSRVEATEQPAHQPVRIADVVETATARVSAHAEQRAVRIDAPTATGEEVIGDREQLVVAVANLLDNAIKYSDDGSTVRVSVAGDPRSISVVVADEGIGIPARDLDRIFERFYRVDSARDRRTGGTGLGLAIVRHVAANHDGEVLVESQEGVGSTFTLALPRPAGP